MKLSDEERELLLAEVAQAAEQIQDTGVRASYRSLLAAVETGEVTGDLMAPLQALLEVGLETGRIRSVHTAHGEAAARRLYAQTPGGAAIRASVDSVNDALRALEGQTVQEVRLTAVAPGLFTLSLGTDQGRLLVEVDRRGARVRSLEVG